MGSKIVGSVAVLNGVGALSGEAVSKGVEAALKRIEAVSGRCFYGVMRRYDLSEGRYGAVMRCYDVAYAASAPAFQDQSKGFSYHEGSKRVVLGMLWVCSGSAEG